MIPAGNYKGTLIEYGIRKTKNGDPAMTAAFSVEASDGSFHKIFWQSGWVGQGADITNNALVTMGFNDARKLPLLAQGKVSGLLDTDKQYDLTVIVEADQNDPEKKYNKVKWINDGALRDLITVQEFGSLAGQRELVSLFMAFAEKKGLSTKNIAGKPGSNRADEVQIPF